MITIATANVQYRMWRTHFLEVKKEVTQMDKELPKSGSEEVHAKASSAGSVSTLSNCDESPLSAVIPIFSLILLMDEDLLVASALLGV